MTKTTISAIAETNPFYIAGDNSKPWSYPPQGEIPPYTQNLTNAYPIQVRPIENGYAVSIDCKEYYIPTIDKFENLLLVHWPYLTQKGTPS